MTGWGIIIAACLLLGWLATVALDLWRWYHKQWKDEHDAELDT